MTVISSLWARAVLALLFLRGVQSQYSDCHNHGTVRYCVLPNGEEVEVPESITGTASSSSSATAPAAVDAQTTAVTDCRMHGATQFCIKSDGEELMALVTGSALADSPPASYTGCHSHDTELYCYGPDEEETPFVPEAAAATAPAEADSLTETTEEGPERNCHFHAGVEHCTGGGASEEPTCIRVDRDYNVPLRVGTLFAMMATSSIAVFGPLLIVRFSRVEPHGSTFIVLKQFGTGVIISTAFVHLLTHAQLMFANECLEGMDYEATASAIAMAGAFLAFLLQFISLRIRDARSKSGAHSVADNHIGNGDESDKSSQIQEVPKGHVPVQREDAISVLTLEIGIVFHSVLIGITLVVSGDSFFLILFVVIVFHQGFEGLALGTRLASLPSDPIPAENSPFQSTSYIRFRNKLLLAALYAIVTPLGMGIGIGALQSFDGNDTATIVAIGTLDALSAGILIWSGFIQMWSWDWLYGEMRHVGWMKGALGISALIGGMALMSLLGKWA